ncbi:hypothetical protein QJ48_22905 [Paenibacillus sp. A3]|nr:hypothetical protein QJ48_22905 [Paenibacillus sp. A3]
MMKPHRPNKSTVGIMTTQTDEHPPFANRGFYRRLCILGSRSGLTVFVFTPQGIDWSRPQVTGYVYDAASKEWVILTFELPAIVYDRCFFTARRQYADYRNALQGLKQQSSVRLLGHGLKGKWDVQQALRRDGRFDRHLPETQPLRSMRTLADWLRQRGEAILKPRGGSQGRGVLLVRRESASPAGTANAAGAAFTVRGRDPRNRAVACGFADAGALLRWLRRFVAQRSYLLQQYLPLQSQNGDAYDVRALVQKDGDGRWKLTGMAVRRGQNGSLTSNLHGGGTVEPIGPFLAREFGPTRAEKLLHELKQLAVGLPEALESCHGRLAELGIDFGVDTDGNSWILEVNSKPGRSIFTYLQDDQAKQDALANPLRYARYLLRQPRAQANVRQKQP